jgi:hypothetical protein
METHAVRAYNGRYGDFDMFTLFWGALVVVALFGFCFIRVESDRLATQPEEA